MKRQTKAILLIRETGFKAVIQKQFGIFCLIFKSAHEYIYIYLKNQMHRRLRIHTISFVLSPSLKSTRYDNSHTFVAVWRFFFSKIFIYYWSCLRLTLADQIFIVVVWNVLLDLFLSVSVYIENIQLCNRLCWRHFSDVYLLVCEQKKTHTSFKFFFLSVDSKPKRSVNIDNASW